MKFLKKDIETVYKNHVEMKNAEEGIKSRLNKAEDWISELKDKGEKKTPSQSNKIKKDSRRMRIV